MKSIPLTDHEWLDVLMRARDVLSSLRLPTRIPTPEAIVSLAVAMADRGLVEPTMEMRMRYIDSQSINTDQPDYVARLLPHLPSDTPDRVLFGIRSSNPEAGVVNDLLGLLIREGPQSDLIIGFGSTDPTSSGTAIMKTGYYPDLWRLGKHRERYTAGVQQGTTPVNLWRDRNHDEVLEPGGEEDSGWKGINFHYAGFNPYASNAKTYPFGYKLGSKSTLGCQVMADPHLYRKIMDDLERSGQVELPYLLLDEKSVFS